MDVNDRVTVAERQLHGNQTNLQSGSVVAISGGSVKVHIDGEGLPRDFPVDKVQASEATFGTQRISPFQHAVIDGIRRR